MYKSKLKYGIDDFKALY